MKAKKEFQEKFGKVSELNVEPISENKAKIIADGLSFIAIREPAYIRFYLQRVCANCGNMFTHKTPCEKIADIGFLLMKSEICDACLYRDADITPEKSPAERVLELMSEILEIVETERSR